MKAILFIIAIPFLFLAPAQAFTLKINPLTKTAAKGWGTREVIFDYDLSACPSGMSDEEILAPIREALALWNSVPTAHLLVQLGDKISMTLAEAEAQSLERNPVVLCDPHVSATLEDPTGGDVIPAYAAAAFSSTGHIGFGYLALNAEPGKNANISALTARDISIVAAHELGHVLGLGHSADVNALMYFDATKKTELNLGQDDMDGITYLYPRNESDQGKAFGCATVASLTGSGSGPGAGPTGSGAVAELALLMLFCFGVTRFSKRSWANLSF